MRTLVGCVLLVASSCHRPAPPSKEVRPAPTSSVPRVPEVRPRITVRAPDAFYDPPPELPALPGVLLRREPLEGVTLPAGMQGWRILYTTTIDDQTPATAVATVFAPTDLPSNARPVIAWAHGTRGALQKCMPSLSSVPTEGIPARDQLVAEGWIVVATDYSFVERGGPHPYLIGEGEARAVLDAVRAAQQLRELTLGRRTVVWGHSQGGHAALWTGILAPRYAPEIELAGIVAIAPAANVQRLLERSVAVDKLLGPYLALAYSRFYPDLTFEDSVRPEALGPAGEIASLCATLPPEDPQRSAELATTFEGRSLATSENSRLAARIAQNTPDAEIEAPLVIAQGRADVVVPVAATDAYIGERCAAGQRLAYWTFAGRDHASIVDPGSPLEAPLVAWTRARFAARPQATGCARAVL